MSERETHGTHRDHVQHTKTKHKQMRDMTWLARLQFLNQKYAALKCVVREEVREVRQIFKKGKFIVGQIIVYAKELLRNHAK